MLEVHRGFRRIEASETVASRTALHPAFLCPGIGNTAPSSSSTSPSVKRGFATGNFTKPEELVNIVAFLAYPHLR